MASLLRLATRFGFLWASCLECRQLMVVDSPGGERCLNCELVARASVEALAGG